MTTELIIEAIYARVQGCYESKKLDVDTDDFFCEFTLDYSDRTEKGTPHLTPDTTIETRSIFMIEGMTKPKNEDESFESWTYAELQVIETEVNKLLE